MKNQNRFALVFCIGVFASIIPLIGCAPMSSVDPERAMDGVTSAVPDLPGEKPIPLPWETVQKDGPLWSVYTRQLIDGELGDSLLPGAEDITDFCSNYPALSRSKRVQVWAHLVAAMTKYESGYNPLSRYLESTMGTDPITGAQVYSEGLLQLSYQDVPNYGSYCEFDWSKDRQLDAKDPRKTILDPYKNLQCGLRILASQVRRRHRIGLTTGVYWAVLREGGKYTKLPQIKAQVQKLSFCTQ